LWENETNEIQLTRTQAARWGLPLEAVAGLPARLKSFWLEYGQSAKTRTRDTRTYGEVYLSGLLRMESKRNITEIARRGKVSVQNMQHFISQSPWSAARMIEKMQRAVAARTELAGGMLVLDESADEKTGTKTVGVSRQYNGRQGKVDQCQVGTFLTYVHNGIWTWVDGEVFLPERWFSAEYEAQRAQAGIPAVREFSTKIQLGWAMIERALVTGLPFVAVAFDSLYGRSTWLLNQCRAAKVEFYADIPETTLIYLHPPLLNEAGQVVGQNAVEVKTIAKVAETDWQHLDIRPADCGILRADFAHCPVWTLQADGTICAETLLIRRDKKRCIYTLTNADPDLPLHTLAFRKSERYFVERSIQDAKSELGWDDLQAIKLQAWQHHLALTLLASWFIAETRLDWRQQYPADPTLIRDYDQDDFRMDLLPQLSMANVRALLRATLPLPQLSLDEAADLVLSHLDNRTRSRRSRLKSQRRSLI
jgi:SRSO17 transposase